jgi:hypothetical protein
MGVYPKPFTDIIHPAVMQLLEHVAISKLWVKKSYGPFWSNRNYSGACFNHD